MRVGRVVCLGRTPNAAGLGPGRGFVSARGRFCFGSASRFFVRASLFAATVTDRPADATECPEAPPIPDKCL